jgi:hypothetical protein
MIRNPKAGHPAPADNSDPADILLHNGMFRNREDNGKPISGSNADTRDYPEEVAGHNRAFAEWIEDDQNQSLCEAMV